MLIDFARASKNTDVASERGNPASASRYQLRTKIGATLILVYYEFKRSIASTEQP